MKKTLFIIFICITIVTHVFGQIRDSIYTVKLAKKDAESFLLNDADLRRFRQDRLIAHQRSAPNAPQINLPFYRTRSLSNNEFDLTSDFFKPSKYTTPDTILLHDSVYVKAFREAAYKKTAHRRTTGHYVAVYGSIIAGVALLVIFATSDAGRYAGF